MWLSSTNYHKGTSSGSPVHLVGEPGAKTVFITEGPLKGDLSHALSGRTFGCVPGANQYANLTPFLKAMKNSIILCEKKQIKRQNIQRGCNKLAGICRELELPGKMLTWDLDEDGDWAEHVKGVDDYLYDLR